MYHTLPENEIHDYRALKKVLCVTFKISAEQYRKLFRDAQKRKCDTKYHSLFEKWVAMAEMEKGYVRPRKLCIKEKMMESYRLKLLFFTVTNLQF